MSAASGGKFRDGFLSAAFTEFASPKIGAIGAKGAGGTSGRVIAAAVVGGTASKLGGGKFANGAVTAAFMWMYNHEHRTRTFGSTRELRNALEGEKAVFGVRPLHMGGLGDEIGMIEGEWLDTNNVEVLHEHLFWVDDKGTLHNRGFFSDGMSPTNNSTATSLPIVSKNPLCHAGRWSPSLTLLGPLSIPRRTASEAATVGISWMRCAEGSDDNRESLSNGGCGAGRMPGDVARL